MSAGVSPASPPLVVVAWDAVARATLRGLGELPQGLAE